MVLTLLVDLDDTLLGNSMETFIPAYLKSLSCHLSDFIPPETMVTNMLDATRTMISNRDLDRTLKDSFDSHFFSAIGIPEENLRVPIKQFYDEVFSDLKKYTVLRPEAHTFIKDAFTQGHQIAIATNPLFPLSAIQQRLDWAGLKRDSSRFILIPSYETFHFAKPDPAYFAEFLIRIGWPNGPILMIGNDPDHDIKGSNLIGIPSYWIRNGMENYPADMPQPDGKGTLVEVLSWINSQDRESLIPDFNTPTAMMAILRGIPAGLSTLFRIILQRTTPDDSKENLMKLCEIAWKYLNVEEELNLPRLKKLVKSEKPTAVSLNSSSNIKNEMVKDQDGLSVFLDFLKKRKISLKILADFNQKDWWTETHQLDPLPTNLYETVSNMVKKDIDLGREVFKLYGSLLPAEQIS